ncbi:MULTISPECIES: trypsin-like serine peptidase [unclassified Streptomyces]|uniref:trypsin-like serine peptidase n=1 Tax=Streptomyces sp. NPDC127532 TaxID=3345399 RepID=UPI00362CA4FE
MRSIRPLLAATGLVAALALTATACGPDEDGAAGSSATAGSAGEKGSDGGLPDGLGDTLKKHGVDPEKWKNGEWRNWNKDTWLREAKDFVNPVIDGLWKPERMTSAEEPAKTMAAGDLTDDQGVSDPEPAPVRAEPEKLPYHQYAAPVGKVFFDSPEGSMVCSGTVVKDPRNPGRSNLVWTAGHCVHAGANGGWYRNIVFVPSYNDQGKSAAALRNAQPQEVAPYGTYWADWAASSGEWIADGGPTGGEGAPYDYAVLHVKPQNGTKSLEETVGNALPVTFDAPGIQQISGMGAWGYPAGPPYNGLLMHQCVDRPGRLSISPGTPTMYRIGCTMTGGSSGGGWFIEGPDGKSTLVSNTSIGPVTSGWLAGPRLGEGAKGIFTMMSDKFAGR